MFHNFGQRDVVDVNFADGRADNRIQRYTLQHRVFIVGAGIDLLGRGRDQILHQLDGVVFIWRIACHRRAADVDVRAAILKGRFHYLDGIPPFAGVAALFGALHLPDVVGVGEAHIADPAEDVAGNVAVAAGRFTRQIILYATQPGFGFGFAVVGDHRRDQCRIVRMLAGAQADFALKCRAGELLVMPVIDRQIFIGIQHPGAH
ncbi:hypothetical protein D3C75_766250 [compost metagenome]